MKLAVVGSRTFHDQARVNQELDQLVITQIISGGAVGADRLAETYAKAKNIPLVVFTPEYSKYGRRAPIIRNGDIVNAAEGVIAFWDGQSPGTKNSIDRARASNKLLKIVMI